MGSANAEHARISGEPAATAPGRIVVVDDRREARGELVALLDGTGFVVESVASPFRLLQRLPDLQPDLIVAAPDLPGLDGLTLVRRLQTTDPDCAVVLVLDRDDMALAVSALRAGASDVVRRPVEAGRLLEVARTAREKRRVRAKAAGLRDHGRIPTLLDGIVGASPAMQEVVRTVLQVAPTPASVLIRGESGTGKELVAAAIHAHSRRAGGPFVRLHCASLAETLLESELFGHERGAFTGAVARREGRLHQADGGTLFLDEISEISPSVQVKLLRFLQEHELERVGGNQTIKVDVRVIAASNQSLMELVRQGRFREDLYYRLNVVRIDVPPLRERPADIPILAEYFRRKFSAQLERPVAGFSDEALARLPRYPWPGNVRELEHSVERAVVLCRGNVIDASELPPGSETLLRDDPQPPVPGASMAELERFAILRTLEYTGGSTAQAARILGISPRKIQYRLKSYRQ